MITLVAQITADLAPILMPWLIGASAVLFLINQGITFWKEHMREKPAPADTYATLEAHEELKEMVRGLATKEQLQDLKEEVDKIDHERRSGVASLHDKLTQTERRLNDRIDALPDRMIRTLRETKGLL